MAEMLIYNMIHWGDNPQSLGPVKKARAARRYIKGDVIEVQPDGFWTNSKRKGWGAPDFGLVIVKGLSVDKAREMFTKEQFMEIGEGKRITITKRAYTCTASLDKNYRVEISLDKINDYRRIR